MLSACGFWLGTTIAVGEGPSSPEARPSGYLDKQGISIDQTAIDRLAYIAGKAWRPRPLYALGVLFRTKVSRRGVCCLATILAMDGATSSIEALRSSK